jgi:hypothetical protein
MAKMEDKGWKNIMGVTCVAEHAPLASRRGAQQLSAIRAK